MQSKYINILGEEYKINTKVLAQEDEYLNEVCGYCDSSTKEIIVAEFKNDIGTLRNLKTFEDKVIRHDENYHPHMAVIIKADEIKVVSDEMYIPLK